MDEDGHNLTVGELAGELAAALALDLAAMQQRLVPQRGKGQPEISDTAQQFE